MYKFSSPVVIFPLDNSFEQKTGSYRTHTTTCNRKTDSKKTDLHEVIVHLNCNKLIDSILQFVSSFVCDSDCFQRENKILKILQFFCRHLIF